MKRKDYDRFKTLRWFITVATLFGINLLFFMMAEYSAGRLVALMFLNVGVGFAIYWLMDYSSSPDPKYQQSLDKVILYPGEFIAMDKAYAEMNLPDRTDGLLLMGNDRGGHYLMVQNRNTGKYSRKYYYSKKESFIVDRSKPRGNRV